MKNKDPYWTKARFPSKCAKTGADIKVGDRIFYFPSSHQAYVGAADEQASREFDAAVADEAAYSGGY